jgi:hypothetical protein
MTTLCDSVLGLASGIFRVIYVLGPALNGWVHNDVFETKVKVAHMSSIKLEVDTLSVEIEDNPDGPWSAKGLSSRREFSVVLAIGNKFGGFCLEPMPGNCGIVVSTGSYVEPNWRGTHSKHFHQLKEKVARHFGYTVMIMTTQLRNIPQVVGASQANWRFVEYFRNTRTGNDCGIAIKVLK